MIIDSSWLSYVPRLITDAINQTPIEALVGKEHRLEAVALFADVSGFTALSEALSKFGTDGTEELTSVLNGYFKPVIDLIEVYGGVVVKFGGDALTILFPYTSDTRQVTIHRAVQCALDMQAQLMPRHESIPTMAGIHGLKMKAGLAAGSIGWTIVGEVGLRLEFIFAGSPLDLSAEAEHHAQSGDVVVHGDLLRRSRYIERIEERGDFWVVQSQQKPPVLFSSSSLNVSPNTLSTISSFLHPKIAERLATGQSGLIDEHRYVTVLFARFDGFDFETDIHVGENLQDYIHGVMAILRKYDGYLNKVDMGDKGSKFIALFGAPVAHENLEERALRCALELQALKPVRIGIHAGLVYCGQVGAANRREYTAMGDSVNLAARLMQAAELGETVVSDETSRQTPDRFKWSLAAHITVKGKANRVAVRRLFDFIPDSDPEYYEPVPALPFVGRQKEITEINGIIAEGLEGRGHILIVTGDSGVGKSHVGFEILRLAAENGYRCFKGSCDWYGSAGSYSVWRTIWNGLFQLHTGDALAKQIKHLEQQLTILNAEYRNLVPVLNDILNLNIPENGITESASMRELRQQILRSLLLEYLKWRTSQSPILLILEDCHLIDPLSQDLLEYIVGSIADLPILVVVISRTEDDSLSGLKNYAYSRVIELEGLLPDDARQMAVNCLSQVFPEDEMPSDRIEQIVRRSEGHPFFIEQLVAILADGGSTLDEQSKYELGDRMRSVVNSRIDRLPEPEKLILLVASVVGRAFKASWISQGYPIAGSDKEVIAHLNNILKSDIVLLHQTHPEREYIFRHGLTRDVIYESMPKRGFRSQLHEAIGQHIERKYVTDIESYLEPLAHHFGNSPNVEKTRHYYFRAGYAAKSKYDNAKAIHYLQALLEPPLLRKASRPKVLFELGEIYEWVGRVEAAETAYREVLSAPKLDKLHRAKYQNALGHLLANSERYVEAQTYLREALGIFADSDDWQGLHRTYESITLMHLQQANYGYAISFALEELESATTYGDERSVSEAHSNIAWANIEQHKPQEALDHLTEALAISTRIDYRKGMIHINGDIAGVYSEIGKLDLAMDYCRQGLEKARDVSYRRGAAVLTLNMGEIYRKRGDWDFALICYEQSLRGLMEVGDLNTIGVALGNMGFIYRQQGYFPEANHLNILAILIGQTLQAPYLLCEVLYNQAELYFQQEKWEEALKFNSDALENAQEIGDQDYLLKAQILDLRLQESLGHLTRSKIIAKLRDLWSDKLEDSQKAAVVYVAWLLDPSDQSSSEMAVEIYERLYEQTGLIEYRERYEALTSTRLAGAPPLPPPDFADDERLALDVVLDWIANKLPSNSQLGSEVA